MYTRVVEYNFKPETKEKLLALMKTDVLNVLKQQPGFIDVVGLLSTTEPNIGMTISFWKSSEDAERYQTQEFVKVVDLIKPFLNATPVTKSFTVETSTFHGIAAAA